MNHSRKHSFTVRRCVSVLALALVGGVAGSTAATSSANAITGGWDARIEDRPYQVLVEDAEGGYCGGSLISPRVVVTAAHCTYGWDKQRVTVMAGSADSESRTAQRRVATRVAIHPYYRTSMAGDIAVVVVNKPFVLNAKVKTIPLASVAQINASDAGVVSGWGAFGEGEESPTILQEVDVPMISDLDCLDGYPDLERARQVCAGADGVDACYGDSGGPLAIRVGNGWRLAGVVSYGNGCGVPEGGVYTEAPAYASWLRTWTTNPNRLPKANEKPLPPEE